MNFDITYVTTVISGLPWLMALLLAWLAGEFGHRWTRLPRISIYGIVGFILAATQLLSNSANGVIFFLANIALGLILFEFGHRINLRWLRVNPWIGIAGFVEAGCTFLAIYILAQYYYALDNITSLLLGVLSMATSPIVVLRIINEQHSTGQVTDRVLHLSALNCVLAVFACKIICGYMVLDIPNRPWLSLYSLLNPLISIGLGILFGVIMPVLLNILRKTIDDGTMVLAIAVIFLVMLTHSFKLSSILATLTFGLVTRHRRVMLNNFQIGFGTLGDLLSILLFVFVASTLEWDKVLSGMGLGFFLIAVRGITKIVGVTVFARISGISWRKGILTGIAVMPFSASLILVLEQTREVGIQLFSQLAPLVMATLVLEILGPIFTQYALIWANEVPSNSNSQ